MSNEVEAIYENGVFRPLQPVQLREHQRVTIRLPECDMPAESQFDVEEDIEPIWRGVFAPPAEEKELFVVPLEKRWNELPRLEVDVTLNPRWFEEEDDDSVV